MADENCDNNIAFADIVQRYNNYLFNYLNKLAGDSAEDLLQETLLRVSQNYSDLKDASSIKAWLFKIATNVAMDHFRSRRTELQCDDDEYKEIPDTNSRGIEEGFIIEEMNDCISRVRIPVEVDRPFRLKLSTRSIRSCPPIPVEVVH